MYIKKLSMNVILSRSSHRTSMWNMLNFTQLKLESRREAMIYLVKKDLIVRKMMEEDVDALYEGFKAQGWNKPRDLFLNYYRQQEAGKRFIVVAAYEEGAVGYLTLLPMATIGPFADHDPEIVDFNVLEAHQNKGIGTLLMDAAEKLAYEMSDKITLSVGMHSGYGSAQRMYVKRGYIPDGQGLYYRGHTVKQYAQVMNDDDLVIYMSKTLI